MNVMIQGTHACADWLGIKIRATNGALTLHYFPNGRLHTAASYQARCPASAQKFGEYRKGFRYADLVADMQAIADECRAECQQEAA